MNELMLFNNEEFGEIRGVEIEGKPYVVANDVAKLLGYKNISDAISRHCKYIVKYDIPHPQSNSKTIEVNMIPEGDVYRLIIKSKLPSAQKFEEWVMDEVLPSLRKTGKYEIQTNNELPQLLNDMTQLVKDIEDKIEKQNIQINEQDKQIEEIKHLVGIRAKDVFDYGKIIKEHLGISKVNKDYNIIKEMFFYEVGVSKWEDLNYSRENVKLLIDICNDYKPSIQINMFED
mgnify:CR=1 FL=1